ncbi:MAG: hypothetical protein B6U89_00780 [Desulfurococcales archaeon ex4484_58]|nr:MAG: hypothetical protein B6U89_00780 [Desulfurococcales archaeon ex4484_58]
MSARKLQVKIHGNKNSLVLVKNQGYGCLHPEIILFPNSYRGFKYWLYYTPYPPDSAEEVFLMRSNDGLHFTDREVKNPVLTRGKENEWDSHHIADPDIVWVNGKFFMYYSGSRYKGNKKITSIGLAISNDGIVWRKYENNPVLKADPEIRYERGYGNALVVTTPTVIRLKQEYLMVYSSIDESGKYCLNLAFSRNGIEWERYEENPILKPEKEYEGRHIDHPKLFILEDLLLMLYLGRRESESILNLAYTYIDNPYDWKRYDKNPILIHSNRDYGEAPILYRVLYKFKISDDKIKTIYRTLRRFSKKCRGTSTWDSWMIYRSTPLVDFNRKLVVNDNNKTNLYYSAYDYYTAIPSIGVIDIEIVTQ